MSLTSISALRFKTINIQSLDEDKNPNGIELSNSVLSVSYFENILEPSITMQVVIASSSSLLNLIPIRGGEKVDFEIEIGNDDFTLLEESSMYVYMVSGVDATRMRETFTLHLASEEYFTNETQRCFKKYEKETISTHVKDILTDKSKNGLGTDKEIFVEDTFTKYAFTANGRKPFGVMQWLGPKSISLVPGEKGNSGENLDGRAKGIAGFLFFENKDGFHYKSIDSLVSKTDIGKQSSDSKDILEFYYHGQMPQMNQSSSDIISWNIDKTIDLRKGLRIGMYCNFSYFYDTNTNKLKGYKYSLKDELGENKLGGDSIPVAETFGDSISRVLFKISDHGTMEKSAGTEDSGSDDVDMAKSFARYNLLFTQALNILVPLNVKLKVGDVIYCEFKAIEGGEANFADPEMSGNYLIRELRHSFVPNQNTTSLKLMRDSYGLYGGDD